MAPHPNSRPRIKRNTRVEIPSLVDEEADEEADVGFLSANCIRALLFIMLRYTPGR